MGAGGLIASASTLAAATDNAGIDFSLKAQFLGTCWRQTPVAKYVPQSADMVTPLCKWVPCCAVVGIGAGNNHGAMDIGLAGAVVGL